ncbi:MAG: precorrin-3B C(17)-methyltransferase [Ruminococcus sp.]|nr:precorrin-3B C(17)-methyltransferase [Ruminococcus sp.]
MKLYIVGFGPGNYEGMTIEARSAIESSDLVVGYTTYTKIIKQYFPEKEYLSTEMRKEKERVLLALENAVTKTVAIICSGDSQLYGMAGLAFELSEAYSDVEIEVVAGVTAAFSGGAVLGAPLTHDCALISLSDLLTPALKIEKRLRCASEGDFVIVLYNPSSKKRVDHLKKACEIILEYRDGNTPCGVVRNIGRAGQESKILTLKELRDISVDMFTTVYIGNSETKILNGKIVTPRGYNND